MIRVQFFEIIRMDQLELELTNNEICNIAASYVAENKFHKFQNLLNQMNEVRVKDLFHFDKFCRAFVALKYDREEFSEVYKILECGNFDNKKGLIDVWDQAHYREKEKDIQRPLSSLMRFRIRKKNPPPLNICPTGERPQHKLPENAKEILKEWLHLHSKDPYPTKEERDDLCQRTGLTEYQVKTWFSNARRRKRRSQKKKPVIVTQGKNPLVTEVQQGSYVRCEYGSCMSSRPIGHPLQNLQELHNRISVPYHTHIPDIMTSTNVSPMYNYSAMDFQPISEPRSWYNLPEFHTDIFRGVSDIPFQPNVAQCPWNNSCIQSVFHEEHPYPVMQSSLPLFESTDRCHGGFCAHCNLRESYDVPMVCGNTSFYQTNEIQNGDQEAALMLLDLQKPQISTGRQIVSV